ncbi:MAG: flagellar basal-body rod protein FlgF [Clostridiales bacterium]|nr:flagellar basal-body rod protein FlgF [Clostridiales bacterium]
MLRGQYMAGTGMMLQRRLMENITHNITNADTTGYKKNHLVSRSFDDVLIQRIRDGGDAAGSARAQAVGPLNFGTRVDQVYVSFEQGILEQTDLNTDLALTGEGFFVLETPQGERYTRSGAFYLTQDGYLVDSQGHFLLGTEGRVQVGGEDFAVGGRGEVSVGDEVVNRLRLVTFANPQALRKQGDSLYAAQGEAPLEEAPEAAVKQGFLEGSNIEIGREMVDMMTVYRVYETNQRILSMIDETVGKAVNEIGRLR